MSQLLGRISEQMVNLFQLLHDSNFVEFQSQLSQLQETIDEFTEFYYKYERLQQLKQIYSAGINQTLQLQNNYIELLNKLDDFRSKQQATADEYKEILHNLQNPKECDLDGFLSVAKNCSLTRFAPAGYAPQASIEPFKPPVPTEDLMRQSVLYNQTLMNIPSSMEVLQQETLEKMNID